MSLGLKSTDRYREITNSLTPGGSIKRQRCDGCGRIRSLGQFPIDSGTCVTCKPQRKGWRRGDL